MKRLLTLELKKPHFHEYHLRSFLLYTYSAEYPSAYFFEKRMELVVLDFVENGIVRKSCHEGQEKYRDYSTESNSSRDMGPFLPRRPT